MESIFEAFAEIIKQHGLPGAIIALLAYGLHRLAGMYHEVQTGRVEDGREAVRALEANTTSLRELIDTLKKPKG